MSNTSRNLALSGILAIAATVGACTYDAKAQTANGRATAANPTYAANQAAPLSLDLTGRLRTVATLSGTTEVGGEYLTTAPTYTNGDATVLQSDSRGNLKTSICGPNSTPCAGVGGIGSDAITTGSDTLRTSAFSYIFNGTSWDRVRGTSGSVNTSLQTALPAGTNNIGDVDIASSLPAGTNNIGDVDIASALPAGTNNIGDVDVSSIPAASSGAYFGLGTTTNSQTIKASAGSLYNINFNVTGTTQKGFLKFYDKATAPTCNVDTIVYVVMFDQTTTPKINEGAGFTFPQGLSFANGISVCVTANVGPTDNTALPAAGGWIALAYR